MQGRGTEWLKWCRRNLWPGTGVLLKPWTSGECTKLSPVWCLCMHHTYCRGNLYADLATLRYFYDKLFIPPWEWKWTHLIHFKWFQKMKGHILIRPYFCQRQQPLLCLLQGHANAAYAFSVCLCIYTWCLFSANASMKQTQLVTLTVNAFPLHTVVHVNGFSGLCILKVLQR